ncbi:lipase 1 [Xylariomycetidae sp. FL2044]|nr:lipase 1 [Xylariomycetidae sp. FL2044]
MTPPTLTISADSERPLKPSQDPWYTAPPDFEASAPGTVLRIRTVPGGPRVLSGAREAYHILYRTTNSRYQPTWAVTSLIIPKETYVSPSGHNALLSYQLAYNTPCIDFGPSYQVFQPPTENSLGIPSAQDAIGSMLRRGWFVNVPDFEGPRAAMGATVLAGHATLDAIRAVLSLTGSPDLSPRQLPATPDKLKCAMLGYSGGSIPSAKAAELQVQYAPELSGNLVGAALGGPPSDIGQMFTMTNKTPVAGNLFLVLNGVMNEFPEVDAWLRSRLRPETAAEFLAARDLDSLHAFGPYAGKDVYSYFLGGEADVLGDSDGDVMRGIRQTEWMLGYHGVPRIPLYVHKAVGDEFTAIETTDKHVESLRRYDVSVLYERNTAGGHVAEIVNGEGRTMSWLEGVFDGSYDGKEKREVVVRDVCVDEWKPPAP